jgi:hypothetical protein
VKTPHTIRRRAARVRSVLAAPDRVRSLHRCRACRPVARLLRSGAGCQRPIRFVVPRRLDTPANGQLRRTDVDRQLTISRSLRAPDLKLAQTFGHNDAASSCRTIARVSHTPRARPGRSPLRLEDSSTALRARERYGSRAGVTSSQTRSTHSRFSFQITWMR